MDQVSEADSLLRSGAVVKGAPTPNASVYYHYPFAQSNAS